MVNIGGLVICICDKA